MWQETWEAGSLLPMTGQHAKCKVLHEKIVKIILAKIDADDTFLDLACFSDEATFHMKKKQI